MAGIGFKLKGLFDKREGYLDSAKAYVVSAIVTEGPMMLCIVMMFSIKKLMERQGVSFAMQETYLVTTTYVMIFSLIVTNTLLLFVSRYISDCIYKKKSADILPSFYGVVFILLLIAAPAAYFYLRTLSFTPGQKFFCLCAFLLMTIVWVQMVYLSAIKKYIRLVIGFAAATACAVGLAAFLLYRGEEPLAAAMAATAIGIFVMCAFYLHEMVRNFPRGRFSLFGFLPALDQYKSLVAVGFFLVFGLFGHNFVHWFGDYRIRVERNLIYCMKYDVPSFYASLTIIPFLIIFVVALEVNFYKAYRRYFDTIRYGGSLTDIRTENGNMRRTLFRELAYVFEIQFFVEVVAVTFVGKVLESTGFDQEMLMVYRYLCMGYCFYVLLKSVVIILLYLDDRKGAAVLSGLFAVLSVSISWVLRRFGIAYYGVGFLVAAALTSAAGLVYLRNYLISLEYHVFCRQPLFYEPAKGKFARLALLLEERLGGKEAKRK